MVEKMTKLLFPAHEAICAQLKDFKEAIKNEQIAFEIAKKDDPQRAEIYLNKIAKFTREETIFE